MIEGKSKGISLESGGKHTDSSLLKQYKDDNVLWVKGKVKLKGLRAVHAGGKRA